MKNKCKQRMLRKVLLRGLFGVPIGIALGYVITIGISCAVAGGYYAPCVPELMDRMGSEIGAVLMQTFCCAIMGAGFGAISYIWEIDHWSLLKQTGIYFVLTSVIMLPIAYITYWMEHTIRGVLIYFVIFAAIFAVIWIVEFLGGKYVVKRMNEKLRGDE